MQRYQFVHERALYNFSYNDLFMRMMSEAVNNNRASKVVAIIVQGKGIKEKH
jgi:hypothetical protein